MSVPQIRRDQKGLVPTESRDGARLDPTDGQVTQGRSWTLVAQWPPFGPQSTNTDTNFAIYRPASVPQVVLDRHAHSLPQLPQAEMAVKDGETRMAWVKARLPAVEVRAFRGTKLHEVTVKVLGAVLATLDTSGQNVQEDIAATREKMVEAKLERCRPMLEVMSQRFQQVFVVGDAPPTPHYTHYTYSSFMPRPPPPNTHTVQPVC